MRQVFGMQKKKSHKRNRSRETGLGHAARDSAKVTGVFDSVAAVACAKRAGPFLCVCLYSKISKTALARSAAPVPRDTCASMSAAVFSITRLATTNNSCVTTSTAQGRQRRCALFTCRRPARAGALLTRLRELQPDRLGVGGRSLLLSTAPPLNWRDNDRVMGDRPALTSCSRLAEAEWVGLFVGLLWLPFSWLLPLPSHCAGDCTGEKSSGLIVSSSSRMSRSCEPPWPFWKEAWRSGFFFKSRSRTDPRPLSLNER